MSSPNPASSAAPSGSPSAARKGMSMAWVAIVVVILVVAGGLGYYYGVYVPGHKSPSGSGLNSSLEMGGFADGQVVTFVYNGSHNYLCTPSMSVMFPGNATASAAASTTQCEVGNASQNAVPQVPQYILVPAFAGLSIFGVGALGANASGFPEVNGSAWATDCGAGGTTTACPDHPTYLYSPLFAEVEAHLNITKGYGGLPEGVLPTPAHDHLLNTATTFPNVEWGITVVLVLDPNIYPEQQAASCKVAAPSNLSSPTGNCLTSFTALQDAVKGCSSSAVSFNSATKNPIWQTLVGAGVPGCSQVYVPGGTSQLNGNLYIPFAVVPGAPPMWPS